MACLACQVEDVIDTGDKLREPSGFGKIANRDLNLILDINDI